ncbi:hypothetical protein TURU_089867 [Turdus rufiventris]|nr:hypothetical protein TURU_089867 [Turdus rufiventris]
MTMEGEQLGDALEKVKLPPDEPSKPFHEWPPLTLISDSRMDGIRVQTLLPFHVSRLAVPRFCSISPKFPALARADGTFPTQYRQCHLLACDTNPSHQQVLLRTGWTAQPAPLGHSAKSLCTVIPKKHQCAVPVHQMEELAALSLEFSKARAAFYTHGPCLAQWTLICTESQNSLGWKGPPRSEFNSWPCTDTPTIPP